MAVRLEVLAPLVGRPSVVRQLRAQLIRNQQRHAEGYFHTITDTFSIPSREERLASKAARAAYWAFTLHQYYATQADLEQFEWYPMAPCNACGVNTGNWCDDCEIAGTRYYTYDSECRHGSPLCSACESEKQCKTCE